MSLPILLLTALALLAPGSALAATETTQGYTQEPNKPPTTTAETTPQATTTPSTGTSPSKEEGTAATTPSKETTPTSSTSPEAKTLPFTGFDLRWSFAIGLGLMIAGFSIVGAQRRRRSER